MKGAINSTFSFVKSATYLAIRCALDHDVPNNAGVYRCIAVSAPEGSILNPRMPAPVAARALTGYRVVDTVLGALAQVAPARLMAAGEGGNTVVAIGGYQGERPFVLVDMINGAWGGRDGKDGIEGVTNPSQNMSNLPVETLEARYPLRVEEYALRPDSGGAGRWRGGLGLVRQYRLLAERAVLQLRSDRTEHAPWGLFGGRSGRLLAQPHRPRRRLGAAARQGDAGDRAPAPSSATSRPAAGGWGDPAGRDPAAVAADLARRQDQPGTGASGLRSAEHERGEGGRRHRRGERHRRGDGAALRRRRAGRSRSPISTSRAAPASRPRSAPASPRSTWRTTSAVAAFAAAVWRAPRRGCRRWSTPPASCRTPCAPPRWTWRSSTASTRSTRARSLLVNRAFGAAMAEAGQGVIVNLGSLTTFRPSGQPAYAMGKAAIRMMTEVLAAELGPRGVRVNAVAPGYVLTPAMQARIDSGQRDPRADDRARGAPPPGAAGRRGRGDLLPLLRRRLRHHRRTLPVDCGWLAASAYTAYAAVP